MKDYYIFNSWSAVSVRTLFSFLFSEIPVGGSFTPPRMCMSEDAAEAPPPDLREATARFLPQTSYR